MLADENGEVRGGQERLAQVSGYSRKYLISLLDECEEYTPSLLVRMGFTSHQRVFVPQLVRSPDALKRVCVTCGDPVSSLRGAQHCPACLQGERSDRDWKPLALRMTVRGRALRHTDTKIAYSIHVKTGRPIISHGDEGQGTGSGRGEGIVNFLVAEGIFPEEMLGLRAGRGHSVGEGADD